MIRKKKRKEKQRKKLEKIKRISSGIKNFDRLTEGGFEENSVNLVIGGSGSGKSIFAIQFLIEGIEKGEKSLYITFEEKKEEFYNNMSEFGWDLAALEKKEMFFFIEYTPEKVKTMLEEGGGTIESLIIREKIKRVVIDSITSFELLFEQEIEKREAALALFSMLRKWECTSVLTYQIDLKDKKSSSHALEFEADSIIFLYFIRGKKERERFIEVLKMRGTKHSREVYPFFIEKNGIVIGTKPYSDGIKF